MEKSHSIAQFNSQIDTKSVKEWKTIKMTIGGRWNGTIGEKNVKIKKNQRDERANQSRPL